MSKKENFYRDKVIIITGASSGIGLAATRMFASKGAKLCLGSRSIDKLNSIAAELLPDDMILCVKTDVTIEDDCRNLIEKCVEKFGKIDILINNAGVSMRANFIDTDLSVISKVMDTNFWGTVYCTKYALPHLLKTQGSLVGVISIAGYAGLPARTGYSSSKFAVRGFLDSLRIEHMFDKLHVLVFAPGFTKSNIRENALLADGSTQGKTPRNEDKMMTAEKTVKFLDKGLRRRRNKMILTGAGRTLIFLNTIISRIADRMEFNYMAKEEDSPINKPKKGWNKIR